MTTLAITFDVGGTLISPWPSVGHIYSEVAQTHGFPPIAPEVLDGRFARAWRNCASFSYLRSEWEEIVVRCFADDLQKADVARFFPALYERFTQADAWHIHDDLLPTLETLRSMRCRMGVISNWDDRLRPLLENLGLASWFEVTVASCEVGAAKPDRRVFGAAAEAFELSPDQILHVGDSAEADFEGAKLAGFGALLLDRRSQASGRGVIRSLAQIPELLSVPGRQAGE